MGRDRQMRSGRTVQRDADNRTAAPPREHGISMFSHMFRDLSFTDARRRALTLVDVIADSHTAGPLHLHRIASPLVISWLYWTYILPMISLWGTGLWSKGTSANAAVQHAGGPAAAVNGAILVLVTAAYLCLVFFGVRLMERRPPVQEHIFECMVVYNATQALLNLRLALALFQEVRHLGYESLWGNPLDTSHVGHTLGMLIWFQYHCRMLDCLDTVFMVLRKKFQRISFVHVYLRLLNLWGWFIVCRLACGGDSYFPAIINCTCQAVVYSYYLTHLVRPDLVTVFGKARVGEIQVLQFMVCSAHAAFVLVCGNLPRSIAVYNLFVMGTCLVFYMDFDDEHPRLGPRKTLKSKDEGFGNERLTLCFDSCGWLYCYHFGVAQWIQEHMIPEDITSADADGPRYPEGIAFSGASGGSLVAGALGCGINVRDLFEYVVSQRDFCNRNPFRIFIALEAAMNKFLPTNCASSLSGRVRVLLTRVMAYPPFVRGEIVDQYKDTEEVFRTLRASCHIPGMFLQPYKVCGRYYFDGLLWSSFFVPWVSDDSLTVRVSALSRPLTDIRAPLQPLWWALLPPRDDVLRGMFWTGYRDAARWFSVSPVDQLGLCRCRRAQDQHVDGDGGNAMIKFQAAQKLIVKRHVPSASGKDPVTGQDVEDLVMCYNRSVERHNFCVLSSGVLAAAFVLSAFCAVELW